MMNYLNYFAIVEKFLLQNADLIVNTALGIPLAYLILKPIFEGKLSTIKSYVDSFKAIIRKHEVTLPHEGLVFKKSFIFRKRIKKSWYSFYNVSSNTENIPFMYHCKYTSAGIFFFLKNMGVNLKNFIHLRHEIEIKDSQYMVLRKRYTAKLAIKTIMKSGKDAVVVHLSGGLEDKKGNLISSEDAFFLIKNVPAKLVKNLKTVDYNKKYKIPNIDAWEKRLASNTQNSYKTFFHQDLGKAYAELSGDTNFIHTNKFIARFVGFKNVFVQGLYTFNYLIKFLTLHNEMNLQKMSISFIKPVYLNEEYRISANKKNVVLSDTNNKICVIGAIA